MTAPFGPTTDLPRPTPSPRRRQVIAAVGLAALGLWAIDYGRTHHLIVGPRLPCLIAGAALVATGLIVRALASLELSSTWHIEGLVTTGIYARTRNPIYLAFALITLGVALASRTWPALPWAALCLAVFWLIAVREEADLHRAFGEAYERYRRSVPRFLPRL
jgi:protein-S-isoprenylcysteine O-methyltransferase Ste14